MAEAPAAADMPLRGVLTQRLTRASRHLKGLFFAANPGERYVLANDCVSLARILDVCSDFLLRGFMDHDLGKKGATFKSFFTAAGITALRYDGTHGKNTETNEKIIWWSFGPPRFHTPADQMTRSFASLVSAFKINAITKGLPLLSRPVVRGEGGRPSHVEVDIFDPVTGKMNKDPNLGVDENFAWASLCLRAKRPQGDVTTMTVLRKYMWGGPVKEMVFTSIPAYRGVSARSKRRRASILVHSARRMAPTRAAAVELLTYSTNKARAYDDVCEAIKDQTWALGDSLWVLHLVGTETAYRELASKLRLRYNQTILMPIGRLRNAIVITDVAKGTFKTKTLKKNKKGVEECVTADVWWWHVEDVYGEVVSMFNDLGNYKQYRARTFGEAGPCLWLLFGGDAGGKSFKFGCVIVNCDTPQSPMRVRWLSAMGGAKDTRQILERSALSPEVCAQVNSLKGCAVLHAFGARRGDEPFHTCALVPLLPLRAGRIAIDNSEVVELKNPSHEKLKGAVELVLAEECGYVVGVAVLGGWLEVKALEARWMPGTSSYDDFLKGVAAYAGQSYDGGSVRKQTCLFKFAEPLEVEGLLLYAEVLPLMRMLSADNDLYASIYGHMGASSKLPCWACDATKDQMKRHIKGLWRSKASIDLLAKECRFQGMVGKMRTEMMSTWRERNPNKSIEWPALLNFCLANEVSYGEVHWLIGTGNRGWKGLRKAFLNLGALNPEIARTAEHKEELREALEKAGQALAGLDWAKLQAKRRASAAKWAVERAEEDAKSASERLGKSKSGRSKKRLAKVLAVAGDNIVEKELEREEADEAFVVAVNDYEQGLAQEADAQAKYDAVVLPDAAVLIKATDNMAKQLRVGVDSHWAELTGVAALRLFKHHAEFWNGVAAACPDALAADFQKVREVHEPFWQTICTISTAILKVNTPLSDEQIDAVEAAVKKYHELANQIEAVAPDELVDVNLKRHSIDHIMPMLRKRKSTGDFSESCWESWHARVNVLERAYSGFTHDSLKHAAAVRKAWLVHTHPEARAADEEFREKRRRPA